MGIGSGWWGRGRGGAGKGWRPRDACSATQSVAAVTQQLEAAAAGRLEAERQVTALTARLEAVEAEGAGEASGGTLL